MPKKILLQAFQLGPYHLHNRMVMAPMTRQRAGSGFVPTALNALYYQQRASAGLIISEGSQIAPMGRGYEHTPGIYNEEQVAGWRLCTHAVHQQKGRIFLQLWHVGRHSHPCFLGGVLPVAPSAIRERGFIRTPAGKKDTVVPRALETEEVVELVQDFRRAAVRALQADFDGVEIHAANGYLIDQFLQDSTNHRKDRYGGSIANRARFLLEVTDAVCEVWGSGRVGVRLSPSGLFGDMYDTQPIASFSYAIQALNQRPLAYLHLVEPFMLAVDDYPNYLKQVSPFFRKLYTGTLITSGGYDFQSGNQIVANGQADLVAYGKAFISNPDLPARFAAGAPLNPWDVNTFYGGNERGYTDYPFLETMKDE